MLFIIDFHYLLLAAGVVAVAVVEVVVVKVV
jgi:hypothetical protein